MKGKRRRVIGLAAAGLLLLGGGAAVASTGVFDPEKASQEIIAGAAQDLGVGSGELRSALRSAMVDQVDVALNAGDITQEQADAMKETIESNDFPLVGIGFGHHGFGDHGFGGFGPGPGGMEIFNAAADYLGLSDEQIRTRLMNGRTPAQIARAENKSVEGLVDVLVEAHRSELQEAVDAGRLTENQRDEMLEGIEDRVREFVEDGFEPGGPGFPHHGPSGPGSRPGWQ